MRNHAGDLYTLLAICWPQGLKSLQGTPMSRTAYEERFCRVTHKTFGGSRMIRVIEGSKNLDSAQDPDRALHDAGPQGGRLQGPAGDHLGCGAGAARSGPSALSKAASRISRRASPPRARHGAAVLAALARENDAKSWRCGGCWGLAKLRGATEYIVDMLDNLPDDRKVLVFAHHAHVIAALIPTPRRILPGGADGLHNPTGARGCRRQVSE